MQNKLTAPLIYIIIGAIVGAAAMRISEKYCCSQSCSTVAIDTTGLTRIDTNQATTYFKAYLNNPHIDTFMAFTINSQQYNAMKHIASLDKTVSGFRIYMGMDNVTPLRIVVGTGSPEHTDNIFTTTAVGSGPCPYSCDQDSPIFDPE